MASSGELIRRRSEYYAFRENLRDLASKIKMAADEFYTPVEIISENFTINDEPGDGYKLRNYQRELEAHYEGIMYRMIPNIDQSITNITVAIERALQAEAAEAAEEE